VLEAEETEPQQQLDQMALQILVVVEVRLMLKETHLAQVALE
jgi:hypothetical protein